MLQVYKRRKYVRLRQNTASVLSGGQVPTIWRLDVREDSNDGGVFVATTMPSRWWPERQGSRQRLGHYITAGGMRAHYWSTVDDIASNRQWRAIRIMLTLAAIWLLFWFIPGT